MGALQHLHTRDDTELSSMSGTPTLPTSSRPPLAALTRNNSTGHSPLGPRPMERQASSFTAGSCTEQASSFTSSLQRNDSLAQERKGGLTAQDATAGNLGVAEDVRNLARSEAGGGARGAKLEVLGSGQPLSRLHSVSVTSLQEQDSLDSKAPPPISIPDSTFAHFPSSHAGPPHNNPFLGQPADGVSHPLHTPPAGSTAHAHSFPGPNTTAGGFETQIPTWQPASRSPTVHPNSPIASANQLQNRVRRSSDPLSASGVGIATHVPQTWINPLSSEISLSVQPKKAESSEVGRPLSPRETRITVDSSPRPSRFGQKEGASTKPSGGGDSDEDDGGPLLQAWRSGNLPIEMRSDSTLSRFNKRLPSLRVPHSPGGSKRGQPSPNGSDKITPALKHPQSEIMSPDLGGGFANEGSGRIGLESPRPMPSRVFNRTKTSRLGDPRENGMFASKDTVIHKPDAVAKSGLLQKSGLQKSGVFERPTNSGLLKKSDSGFLKKSGLLGRAKTKVGRSGQLPKGGALERVDEDDDSLEDDDVPENWWAEQNKCSWFTILQWVALVLIIALFITSTAVWGEVKLLGVLQWKWLLILLVVVSGRLISGWLVKIVVFILERNFLMKKRVLYFVYSLKSGVQNCLWMGLVTACWYAVMDPKVRDVDNRLQYVTRVILCIFVASALKLAEVLFIKVTASRYHVNRFFERIQDTLFHQHILETLSAPPTLGWEAAEKEEEEATTQSKSGPTKSPEQLSRTFGTTVRRRSESGPLGGSPRQRTPEGTPRSARSAPRETVVEEETGKVDIDKLQQLSSSTVSAWSMKRLINLVRYQGISTYSDVVEAGEEINSEMAAKAAARQIFYNVAKPNSRYITIDDLRRFLTGDEVARTWMMFEGAVEKGHITKKSLKAWVVTVYNERRSLSLTLNDTKTVVKKLKGVLDALLWAVIVVVWLTILGIASSNLWVVLSSLLISWVFVFGNMAKTLFEAIVFIFVMHPFDVGDRIEVDGNQMVVEEMNILTTVFLRADNGKTYLPNSVLAQKQIVNMGRSSDMGEAIDFFVDSLTPAEKIAALKERIGDYLKALPHHWYPTFFLLVRDIDKTNNRMQCSFWGQHTMNHQNAGERHTRRGALLQHLLATMRELGINYSIPTQEVRLGGRLEGFGKA